MTEENDRPEDEDENPAGDFAEDAAEDMAEEIADDEDDSDLFEPPSEGVPPEDDQPDDSPDDRPEDVEDPLGDALAQAAAGDILSSSEAGSEAGDENASEHDDAEEDDSDLFEPPQEEIPEEEEPWQETEPAGHQPVLPTLSDDEEAEEEDDAADDAGDDDLFGSDEDDDDDDEPRARQRYPWLQSSGEEEEEEFEEAHSLQGRTLIFVGAAVVFVIFSALIWFLYAQGDDAPGDEDVTLVEAPEGPAKVAPDDRGGLEVPDQDKLVYDRVSGQETEMEDNLLDGPEDAAVVPEAEPEQTAESLDTLMESLREEAPADVETAPVAAPVVAREPEVAVEPTPVETAPPPVVSSGTHFVQLGSYGSAERAEVGWRTITIRHSILLAGLAYDVQRADLGARGIVYRLRIEALGETDARNLCADLKAAGQDCLVVRR